MDNLLLSLGCGAALAVAAAMILRWGRTERDTTPHPERGGPVRRALRGLAILVASGAVAGLLVGGAGGRLMMRIMAATSPPAAQGRLTEAEEIVGEITLGGTIGFLIFIGLLTGLLGAAAYGVIRRFLPRRAWPAGAVTGALLLVVFARLDPLDPTNKDFRILRPAWLAVLLIAALSVMFGMTLAAVAERLDRAYPPLEPKPGSLLVHFPLLLFLVPALAVAAAAVVAGAFVVSRAPVLTEIWRSRRTAIGGRAVLAAGGTAAAVWLGTAVPSLLGIT